MSAIPSLTARLRLAAEFVRKDSLVADIGTDHAYLPVYLVNTGRCPRAAAGDIRPGPLERARRTVEKYGAGQKVELFLADGLDGVSLADDVVIAGMGGETIAAILERCGFIRNPNVQLVLQPMTDAPQLRKFLCENGFEIRKEAVARERNKLYVVISARWGAKPFTPDAVFCLAGRLPQTGGPLEGAFLSRIASKLRKQADGLRRSRFRAFEADEPERLARELSSLAQECAQEKTV